MPAVQILAHILPVMNSTNSVSGEIKGIGLALLAVIIWAGNFVIARSVVGQIGPITLAFFRWFFASLLMLPIGWTAFKREWSVIKGHLPYLMVTALFGIALFNTLVYIAGHYTGAINMAMLGTTSSPIFSIILAYVFLKDKPGKLRIVGIVVCISGIVWLLSGGSWNNLRRFHLTGGDTWVLGGAFCFAVYNIQVRRKPSNISALPFLLVIFSIGTLLLVPGMIWENFHAASVKWSYSMAGMILYLAAGTSVIAFLVWNAAIAHIGIGRTVLFGYLIPLVSAFEAVFFLGEQFNRNHLISACLIAAGLFLTNVSPDKWLGKKNQ